MRSGGVGYERPGCGDRRLKNHLLRTAADELSRAANRHRLERTVRCRCCKKPGSMSVMQCESRWPQKRSRMHSIRQQLAIGWSPRKQMAETIRVRQCSEGKHVFAVASVGALRAQCCNEGKQLDLGGGPYSNERDDLESRLCMSRRKNLTWHLAPELSRAAKRHWLE